MEKPYDNDSGRRWGYTMRKDPPSNPPVKDRTLEGSLEPDDIEVYVKSLFDAATPRELNPGLSESIYYGSEDMRIKLSTMRKYIRDFLFDKFPGKNDIPSIRDHVVSEVCNAYEKYLEYGESNPEVTKKKPADYKDWQVEQLLRGIIDLMHKISDAIKNPAKVPIKKDDPFDDDLPREKVVSVKVLVLKLDMLSSLLKDL